MVPGVKQVEEIVEEHKEEIKEMVEAALEEKKEEVKEVVEDAAKKVDEAADKACEKVEDAIEKVLEEVPVAAKLVEVVDDALAGVACSCGLLGWELSARKVRRSLAKPVASVEPK